MFDMSDLEIRDAVETAAAEPSAAPSPAERVYVGSLLAAERAAAASADVDDQDCHAAVSPLAYLADLLYYAATHLSDAGGPVTVAGLEARLHQPFGSMGCGDITYTVPQVRVAVEVLRRHLATLAAPGDTAAAEAAYRMTAYEALLVQAGTTFQEVRLATTDEARQALADRLGLLASDVAAFPVAPAQVTEAALESVFGLLDTTRATRPGDPPPATPLLVTARRAALRREWASADHAAGSAPVVDPDVLRASDFVTPLAANAAHSLWSARVDDLQTELAALAAARAGAATEADGFDAMLAHRYGAGAAGALSALAAELEAGHGVSAALAPYHLALDAFRRLWDVRRLAVANAAITAEEWSDADSILARAWKGSQAARWLADETTAGVTRGPDFFLAEPEPELAFPPEPEVALAAWRATDAERRAHLRTLGTRLADDAQVETALAAAVTAAEQAALPALRDALVLATADPAAPAEERTLAARAKWVGDHLLIDAQTDGRVATTRLAQATQTLQDLLFAVRTEQLEDSDPDLVLNAPDFDREWAWLGEYGAWRSAMFVFLYPENVLVPSLRRRQSPAFQRLARQLRANRQLSPDVARTWAAGYAGYLRDVCALSLEAWCTAGAGEERTPTQFFFARAVPTAAPAERVYWSWRDPAKPATEQAFWDEVPGLTGVVKLYGARVYEPYGERFVYLFARVREFGQDRLVFTRYNLDTGAWNQSPVELDDPDDVQESKVSRVWLKLTAPTERPHLGIQPVSGPAYFRGVNDRGTAWQSGDFRSIVQRGTWTRLADLDLSVAGAAARPGTAGDFDGDGRAEIAAAQDARDADGNLMWAVGLRDGGWRHLGGVAGSAVGADLKTTDEPVAAGFTLAGDFDGDGRDELFVAPDWARSSWTPPEDPEPLATTGGDTTVTADESPREPVGDEALMSTDGAATLQPAEPIDDGGDGGSTGLQPNYQTDAWVMAYRDGGWRHLSPLGDHPFNADLRLRASGTSTLRFGAVGDFDGDGRDELALNDVGNSIYAKGLRSGAWVGVGANSGRFSCYSAVGAPSARSITAGDFDGDGRAELAIAASGTGSVRNDFWVMDYDPATGAWNHISAGAEGHPIHADLDCNGDDVPAKFAVAGDFDGDGRDELAVAIDMPGADANSFWVWKLDPQSGDWFGLGASVSQYFAHVWCAPGEAVPAAFALVGDFDQDGRDELAVCKGYGDNRGNDFWVMDYDPEAGGWRHLADFDAGALAEAARWGVAGDLDGDGFPEVTVVRNASGSPGNDGWAWTYQDPEGGRPANVTPVFSGDTSLTEQLDRAQLVALRAVTESTVLANAPAMRLYFDEAWYAVPVLVGQALQKAGQHTAALDWLQRVYDYATRTRVWYGLEMENGATIDYDRPAGWLGDPLDPFAIVATRSQAHTRFTLQALVRCLLEFADAEFTRDTAESLTRARTLYGSALELLDALDAIRPAEGSGTVDLPAPPTLAALVESTPRTLGSAMAIRLPGLRVVGEEGTKDAATGAWIPGLAALSSSTFTVPANPAVQALRIWAEVNLYKLRSGRNIAGVLRDLPPYAAPIDATTGVPTIGSGGGIVLPSTGSAQPTPYRYAVLIQRARQLAAQAQQVESMMLSALEKLDAEAYTAFRAQQDARVAEAQVTTAQYRVQQAQGGVTLAELQLGRAAIQENYYEDLVDGGLSGWETAQLWLMGLATVNYAAAAIMADVAAVASVLAGPGDRAAKISAALTANGQALASAGGFAATVASFERRRAEWDFQLKLARQEILIGNQQVDLARTEVRVATQEQKTAELQSRNAAAVVDFLARKFTGVELYEWMSGIMQGVYAGMLQQATSMARLAERQLAFERQESVQNRIAADYWSAPGEAAIPGQSSPDRSGLTGSARLAADLEALDQHAFESDRRRLQLSRTVSLLRLDPARFQLFRETGLMVFETPTELFDRDFPGHYMRVIRRVKTSVIALVPPTQGIRAELMNIRASKVTVPSGAGAMVPVSLGAAGQTVALTAPMNASGVFELDAQPDLLAPFEGLGVDLAWMFRMPKASNPIDYSTIADVLVTVEYTALDDPTWREVRIRQLGTEATGDRAFSFRQEYADQWFDLNNPPASGNTSTVRFTTVRGDFPANLSELGVEEIVLYLAGQQGSAPLPAGFGVELYRTEPDSSVPGGFRRIAGGTAQVVNGRVDTRAANGINWRSIRAVDPAGGWELVIPNDEATRTLFATEAIADLLLVLTWSGETPAWV
jgi:receptor-binding and translocation channel-forming TcA subunit of Tc toxin/ABC toxin-like protein/VCBS repeat protein